MLTLYDGQTCPGDPHDGQTCPVDPQCWSHMAAGHDAWHQTVIATVVNEIEEDMCRKTGEAEGKQKPPLAPHL